MSDGSCYLVWWSKDRILDTGEDALISKKIESYTFLAVEDWAFENCPVGYHVSSIEKHYDTQGEFVNLFGETDVDLTTVPEGESRRVK